MFRNLLKITVLVTSVLSLSIANGQYYASSAGLRMGGSSGFTYKKFFNETEAMEILLSGRNKGIQISMLYMENREMDISFSDHLFFYFGAGVHLGLEKGDRFLRLYQPPPISDQFDIIHGEKSFFAIGIDGIAGVEYRLLGFPLTIGLDIKPYFNFVGMRNLDFRFWDTALSIKYTF